MGINLREEGARMQAATAGDAERELGVVSGARSFDVRAYRVTNPDLIDRTVAQLEALPEDVRVFIVRVRRGGEIIEPTPDTVIRRDDVVAITARQEVHVQRGDRVGPEVDDKALLDIPIEALDVVVTNRVAGREIAGGTWHDSRARVGYFSRHVMRAGQEIPIHAGTRHRPGRRAAPHRHRA